MSQEDNGFTYRDGVSLREYLESRISAIEKASDLAAKLLDVRLESMNEFRAAMKDQSSQFINRNEYEARRQTVDGDIRTLREYKAALEGKASQFFAIITLVVALLSLFIGLAGIILRLR